jgi:hypothetical protein
MLQHIKTKRGRCAVYAPEQLGSTRCVLDSQQQDGLDHLRRPGHQRWGSGRPSPHDHQGEGFAAVSATLRQVDDEGRWPTNPARLKYVHATSSVRHYRLPAAAVSGAHLCLFVVGAVRLYPRICGRGGKLRSTISYTSLLGNLLGGWTRQPVRTFTSNLAVDRGGRTKPQISDPNQRNTENVAQIRLHDLHDLTSANLLVELPRRFSRFQREFVAELPLTQTILMNGQMRLVKASVAAHKHAVYFLTAHVTVG